MEVREASATYAVTATPQVTKGYKQTEVGVIPEDWNVVPLGSLGSFSKGQGIRKDEASSGDIPCIRYGELYTHHNDIVRVFNSRISAAVARSSKRLKQGDLLFAGSGETKEGIGKCVAFVGDGEAYAGGDIVILSPNKGVPTFFGYLFNSPVIARQKASKGQGDAVVHISANALSSINVPLPPTKAEQEAIAEALSDADALIESLERLLAKKRYLKQGAMQELLTGQKRLPGFSGEWEAKALRKIVQTPVTDGPHLTPRFLDDGIPFLSVNNLVDNKIDLSDLRFISLADHEVFSRKCKPRKGDVLLGKAASVGKVAIVDTNIEFNIWSPIALIRVSSDNDARFVYYQLHSDNLIRQITLLTNSSSQGNIGMGDIEKLTLKLPSKPEQTAIASILSDMDAELAALEAKLAKARRLKQGMMQELLTGRIRLI